MNFRSEFDLVTDEIYLNSGTLSISPREVREATIRYLREYEKNPTRSLIGTWVLIWESQKELGLFLKADPHDLFLQHNVTEAMNDMILGIPLPSGGEIVVTDLEYGAIVNVCRLRAERDGYRLRTLSVPCQPESSDQLVEGIVDQLKADTRLLLVSHVFTGNGMVLPLEKLARETRARGIILAVDGAHAPGAVPMDFSRYDEVDLYGGNLHKWIMGPKGTGFGWVNPRHQSAIRNVRAGWTTYDVPPNYRCLGDARAFTTRFVRSSCHQFSPFFALRETFGFWKKHGAVNIRARKRELDDHLRLGMEQNGWKSLSPHQEDLRGPLLTYELPEVLERRAYEWMDELLTRHGLQIITSSVKGKFRLRLSPHIYNSEEEISRAVEILAPFSEA